jgi:hypothetical protein
MRQSPEEKDAEDGKRSSFVSDLWNSQTWALQYRDRQVEENVRMLAGQQWMIFSDLLQKWIDVSKFLTQDERRWRQRPVVNRLLYWFMLTHARMTENPPVVSFQPSTGDRSDALLAEVMDTVFKTLWIEMDMVEVIDRLMAWLIPGGSSYLRTRVDLDGGELQKFTGPASIPNQFGSGVLDIPNAPYDQEGNALVRQTGPGEYEQTGDPYQMREGTLECTVHGPLEVRAEWNHLPFHRKRWAIFRQYLTPEQVYDTWGVELEPDTRGDEANSAGELQRILFGSGYFGAAGNKPGVGGFDHGYNQGLIRVDEFWHKPSRVREGMEQNGRLLITTRHHVLHDGPRPAPFKGAGPIQRFDFTNLPGRPHGTTPQEMLNPLQRTYNRGYAQILEHRNLVTNPITVIDEQSGLEEEMITNKPGLIVKVNRRPSIPPVEYADPPALPTDVYKIQDILQEEMDYLGNLEGAEGAPPTRDASGELVKELRFNTDRFLGPTMRRAAGVMGRVVEDWMALLPSIWDEEKIIAYAGEDSVTRTVTVLPQMFEEGAVNVHVDIESMLPEGRGERQTRIYRMYADGLLGMPGSPEARKAYFDLARFPHMGRAIRPGGVHRSTAEQENGRLVQGVPAAEIQTFQWYDNEIHLWIHEEFMASPEFLKLDPQVQNEFHQHWIVHKAIQQLQMEAQMAAQLQMQQAEGEVESEKAARDAESKEAAKPDRRASTPASQ